MGVNSVVMSSEKAYLLGLIIGGGIVRNNRLIIKLPYRLWGNAAINPQRAGRLATDILGYVRPLFENTYNMAISFTTEADWQIFSIDPISKELYDDLIEFGIKPKGEIIKNANISKLRSCLNQPLFKRNFVAGIADSKGSLNRNHRRFDDNYQIISFEFAAGNNFDFVFEFCQILQELNCYTDQLLWNHPNLHSSANPYYKNWKKGFKVRVLIDDYVAAGSFLFQAKAEGAFENLAVQENTHRSVRCNQRGISEYSVKTIHIDENSNWLPANLRGLHFLHNKHICAVLGCKYAPIQELEEYINKAEYWINPFPVYYRDTFIEVRNAIYRSEIMKNRTYSKQNYSISSLINLMEQGQQLIWGNDQESGYPLTEILKGITWIIQRTKGVTNTTRISGNYIEYLSYELNNNENIFRDIIIEKPDLLTSLFIYNTHFATLIGPKNPRVYRKLITKHDRLKISVRNVTEEDLR